MEDIINLLQIKVRGNFVLKKSWKFIFVLLILLTAAPICVSAASASPKVTTYKNVTWVPQGNKSYYFNHDTGKPVTGWAKINGKTYYLNKNGSVKKGWLKYNGKSYYFIPSQNGAMAKGIYRGSNGKLYYLDDKTGAARTGAFTVQKSGKKVQYYADNKSYQLLTGTWSKVNQTWYYFSKNGNGYNRWFKVGERRYFCHPSKGKLQGWQNLYGQWYYFSNGSYVLTSQWIQNGDELWFVNELGEVEKKINNSTGTYQEYDKIVMVGDSRFHHTYRQYGITAPNTVFVSKPGEGYDWLVQYGYNRIVNAVKGSTKAAIVVNMGVNDLSNTNKYLNFMNKTMLQMAQKYNCDLYYMSVNPVNESVFPANSIRKKYKKMSSVLSFNKKMKAGLNPAISYIDTCSYLRKRFTYDEMTVSDGVHYTRATSQIIFDRCQMYLKTKSL